MEFVLSLLAALGTLFTIFLSYQAIFTIVGLFKTKKFPPAKTQHTYAFCVAARNEEKVIQNLLQSIDNQNYPKNKMRVFVIADNCTDSTAAKVEEFASTHDLPITIVEHNNPDERRKGYALRYLFNQLKEGIECEEENGISVKHIDSYDGYFIFDADNVMLSNYVEKMNDAFDAGNKIINSFRHSKNFNKNWISFSYAMHWLRTIIMEFRGKSVLNQACRIQGTGYLIANEVLKDGWNYTSTTDDREFCSAAVIAGYKISYCDDAIFFDEQPERLKIALRQRLRWSRGHLEAFALNEPKLFRNLFKPGSDFCTTYDHFWINFPNYVKDLIFDIIKFFMKLGIAIVAGKVLGFFWACLAVYVTNLALFWLTRMAQATFCLVFEHKRIGNLKFWRTAFNIFMFPFFDIIGKWTTYIALFKKVEWKQIPHETVLDVSDFTVEDKKD